MRSKETIKNKFETGWVWTGVFLSLILGIGFFLRTYNLFAIPIFADEAIYIRWAQVMRAVPELRFLPLSDGKQPLFMWAVIPFFKVFQDPLIAGRMVSVLSGVAGVLGVFLVAQRLFRSKVTSLVGALFYAVSPFTVFFDRMALVDSMLASLGVWSLYFAIITAQTLRLDAAMFTGFVFGAAWLTKSPAVFFLTLLPTTVVIADWSGNRRITRFLRLLGLWLVSWFVAVVLYNIQRLGPNFHMIAIRNKDYVFSFAEVLQHPLDPFQFHIKEVVEWLWILLPGTILVAVILGVIVGLRKFWRESLFLLVWVIFPLLAMSEFAKVFTARYILFTIPPLFILAGALFVAVPPLVKKNLLLIAAMLSLPALWIDYLLLVKPDRAPLPRSERSGYLEEWTAGTGIKEVAEYIRQQITRLPAGKVNNKQKEGIVVGTEGFFGTLPDGLQIYVEDIPGVTVIGVGITLSDVHKSLIEAKKAGNIVYLVVNSTRFKGDADKLGLKLINSYKKALRPDGSYESLLFFEVTENAIPPTTITTAKKTS